MREYEIKALLLNELRTRSAVSSRAVLTTEYPLGRTSVRADLALLAGDFIGIEIKSEYDTLRRLPRQLDIYRQYFDRTVLVCAERHLPAAMKLDLGGVELWAQRSNAVELLKVYPRTSVSKPLADLLNVTQRARLVRQLGEVGRDAFLSEFTLRFGPTSREFWKAVARRKVRADDLLLLSRFRNLREGQERLRQERAQNWSQWQNVPEPTA